LRAEKESEERNESEKESGSEKTTSPFGHSSLKKGGEL
jgi:hypothetical protein